MAVAQSSGRNVQYLDEGRGPPVVMVHSGGMSSRQWTRLISRLVDTHRIVAPDLLGSGGSDPVERDHPFDYHEDVAALEAVLTNIPGGVHLVGHSYGGLVALTWARAHPERVRSIAMFEPVAFGVLYSAGETEGVRDLESYDHDGTFFDDAAGGGEAWMERFIDYWNGKGAWQALPASSRASFLKVGRKVYQEVRSLTADRTPHTDYAALTAPALFMTGAKSTVAAQRVCAVLAHTLPQAKLVTLPDAGHMAPLTQAHIVNEAIVGHLRAAEAENPG